MRFLRPHQSFRSVTADNCKYRSEEELYLKGDVSWGAEEQFENEALMAVRTANFISAFLQVREKNKDNLTFFMLVF